MGTGRGVLPTGTVTFLLTDVEASTAAWQRAPELMPLAVARHDVLLDQAITAHGGVRPVEQGEGDSVVAAFERPSDAIAAALDAQLALQGEPWPDGAELRVRMALHTGEIAVRGEGNYAGTTLHRCARLRACAHGGQVVVSRATADLLVDRLPDRAALLDLGPHQLKDLVRPEQVYQLVHPDLIGEFPALRSLDAVRHNLPHQLTPLIGRVDELAAVARALDTDRLVTLTGSAGIGKTRMAVHAAAERADQHADGVAFVDLATIGDPGSVASKVAGVLRVWETTTEATEDAIARFVADRRVLVVLDNCEHVIEACADLANRLLSACPQLTILATSREPLGVPGEVVWRVPPLPAPAQDQPLDLVEASTFDAVRLFGDRARRARPGFAYNEATAAAMVEICRRLDGIPLAIELAAARCRAMTPAQIAEELDRRFLLLTGGARTALARQQTLAASIEWSHDLLAADERAAFRRLGVFSGPFPLAAAEAVCADADGDGWTVFDVLSRLVDKSLVTHDPESGWYQQLETIRLYALERCREVGELERIRDRHATWWAAWLDAHHPDGPSDADVDAIHRAYPNVRVALQWAAATQPELALELAGGLGIYWYLKGVLGDAVSLGDLALASRPDHSPAWARAVGRMVMPRYYANDERFMTDAVGEACTIAEASGDDLTPLRCRACRVLHVDPGEFRDLARQADDLGDLWVAGRLNLSVAFWDLLLGSADADGAIELHRVATIAEELDATSLRLAVLTGQAAQLATGLRVREAIARLDRVMALADRASPTAGMIAFGNLAWYGQLCGEARPVDLAARVLTGLARDWGAMSAFAAAVQGMSGLLAGSVAWDGREVVVPTASAPLLWLLGEAIGEDRVRVSPATTAEDTGDVARLGGLIMEARSRFRDARFREAEAAVAEVVRHPSEDRHFWLLMLARCATDGGSHLEAARLLGAVAGTQERFGLPWLPRMILEARTATEELGRAALGDDAFDRAHAEGFELDLDAAVAYALRARGERKRPSTGWDSLTPTELQVVELVAAGRSNPEIAETLLMGRTTVKTHLGHIFTKLGMTNRAELAAEAARRRSSTLA